MMGKELAVSMETDSGRMRHRLMGNPRGECHPPPGFHCGWQAGTSGSHRFSCLRALSTSVCILLGTAPSGNVCASSHHYPRGLGRYSQSETWHGFHHPEFAVPGKSMAEHQVMGPSWGKGHRLGLGQAGKVRMPMAAVKWHEHLTRSRATPLWFQICYIPHWLSDPLAHHSPPEGPQDPTQLHVSSVLGFGT